MWFVTEQTLNLQLLFMRRVCSTYDVDLLCSRGQLPGFHDRPVFVPREFSEGCMVGPVVYKTVLTQFFPSSWGFPSQLSFNHSSIHLSPRRWTAGFLDGAVPSYILSPHSIKEQKENDVLIRFRNSVWVLFCETGREDWRVQTPGSGRLSAMTSRDGRTKKWPVVSNRSDFKFRGHLFNDVSRSADINCRSYSINWFGIAQVSTVRRPKNRGLVPRRSKAFFFSSKRPDLVDLYLHSSHGFMGCTGIICLLRCI